MTAAVDLAALHARVRAARDVRLGKPPPTPERLAAQRRAAGHVAEVLAALAAEPDAVHDHIVALGQWEYRIRRDVPDDEVDDHVYVALYLEPALNRALHPFFVSCDLRLQVSVMC